MKIKQIKINNEKLEIIEKISALKRDKKLFLKGD
jgi:hypothetical protein